MTRTFVDAGLLIAVATLRDPVVGKASLTILDDPDRHFLSSRFIWLEIMPKAIHHRRTDETESYERFFAKVADWAELSPRLTSLAAQEGQRYGLSALDALHVAAAISLDADELVTTEAPSKPIHRVASVKVVLVPALQPSTT